MNPENENYELEATRILENKIKVKVFDEILVHQSLPCIPCSRSSKLNYPVSDDCYDCIYKTVATDIMLADFHAQRPREPRKAKDESLAAASNKKEDGYYHKFITLTPDPSRDTNATMIKKADKLAHKTGVKEFKYCFEYMQNIKIAHVHLYLKIDNNKHFGMKELFKFNKARVDVQFVKHPVDCSEYVSKLSTKVPESDLIGSKSIVCSPNWSEPI